MTPMLKRFSVLYNSNSNNTKASIGTSDGSSITFGSETEVEYDKILAGDCSYDSVNQKVVFVYRDLNATTLRARSWDSYRGKHKKR